MDMYEDSSGTSATQAEKEEVDSRSIYVGNVRFYNRFLVTELFGFIWPFSMVYNLSYPMFLSTFI